MVAKSKLDQQINLSQFGKFENNELVMPQRFKIIIDPVAGEYIVIATHKELQRNPSLFKLIF